MRSSPRNPRQPESDEELVGAALSAYRAGWFPMYMAEEGVVQWVQPRRRSLIPLDERFAVSRSLRSVVRSGRFMVTSDEAFEAVIRACAVPGRGRESTWLNEEIVGVFLRFHRAGLAHSVEAWLAGAGGERTLVGGLYGLALGAIFCGESMFSRPALGGSNASKVCLVHLVEHLRQRGFAALDAQLTNPHLEQFGSHEITQREYALLLRKHSGRALGWAPFEVMV